jgi:recombinational DNA repair ATPase RecF
MKIHRLTLTNFRGFADATLDLDRPLTVLFGPNGSGKSTVLEALAVVFSEVLQHVVQDERVWIFDTTDEDVRLGSESLVLLGDVSNGTVRTPVRIERRRLRSTTACPRHGTRP